MELPAAYSAPSPQTVFSLLDMAVSDTFLSSAYQGVCLPIQPQHRICYRALPPYLDQHFPHVSRAPLDNTYHVT